MSCSGYIPDSFSSISFGLTDLRDTNVATRTEGDMLVYQNGQWTNATAPEPSANGPAVEGGLYRIKPDYFVLVDPSNPDSTFAYARASSQYYYRPFVWTRVGNTVAVHGMYSHSFRSSDINNPTLHLGPTYANLDLMEREAGRVSLEPIPGSVTGTLLSLFWDGSSEARGYVQYWSSDRVQAVMTDPMAGQTEFQTDVAFTYQITGELVPAALPPS